MIIELLLHLTSVTQTLSYFMITYHKFHEVKLIIQEEEEVVNVNCSKYFREKRP